MFIGMDQVAAFGLEDGERLFDAYLLDEQQAEEERLAAENEALRETVEVLRQQLASEVSAGTTCPVCDQTAKEYVRKLNAGMAEALAVMFQHGAGRSWFHKPTVLRGVGASARDESLLRHWGLIEERPASNDDGHAGWWRVTQAGEDFVCSRTKVRSHVVLYNNEFRGFKGDLIDIYDAGGSRFSLNELMNAS